MMKKEKVLTTCITEYKCLFILVMLASAVPYVHEIIAPYIKILLGIGFLLLLADFVLGRKIWKTKYIWILIAFVVSYGITIVLNRNLYFSENVRAWAYMILIFLLFYGYDVKRSKEDRAKEMRTVYHTFLMGVFICSLVCLFTYLFSYNIPYVIDNVHLNIGMFDNRLWGLYNPNTGATLNVMSILLSLAFLLDGRKKHLAIRICYIINLVLQGICLILTGSRTPIAVCLLSIAVIAGVYLSKRFGCKAGLPEKKRLLQKISGGVITGVLVLALTYGAGLLVKTGMSYVPPMLKNTPISGPVLLGEDILDDGVDLDADQVDLTRKEETENRKGGTLTGRNDLWQAGIKGFLDAPVFGVGREGVYDACQGYLEDKTWQPSLNNGGLHNIALTVLVSSGAVGFLILALFVILTLKDMLWFGFKKKGFVTNPMFLCNVIMLGSFAIMEMLEARILYRVGIFYIFFWMVYGYTIYDVQKEREQAK